MANKYLDDNGLLYFWQHLKTLFAGKVNTEAGKGLSTNDYTTADMNKLAGIEAGAQVNTIETVKVNGTALTPDAQKAVNIETDDSTFIAKAYTTPLLDVADAIEAGKTILVRFGNSTSLHHVVTSAGVAQDRSRVFITTESVYTDSVSGAKTPVVNEYTITATGWEMTADYFVANMADVEAIQDVIPSDASDQNLLATSSSVGTAISTALANSGDAYQTESDVQASIDAALTSLYKYKGSVATYSQLPSSGQEVGDVWNVEADGMNYAWTGSEWDALGGSFTITAITNAEIDAIMAQ